jgi:preprotein translocase subunit SecB
MKKQTSFSFLFQRLSRVDFAINREFTSAEKFDCEPEMRLTHSFDSADKTCRLEITIRLKPGNAPFAFTVGMEGYFEFKRKLPARELEKVTHINCAAILYPFLREFIADLTRRAGFSPLLLPPVNFVNLYDRKQEKQK